MTSILLLTVDCLRADRLGLAGYKGGITPNIDSLANRGTLFKYAFSNGSWTSLSFSSIFTSTYPLMHRTVDIDVFGVKYPAYAKVIKVNPIKLSVYPTFVEIIRRKGFSTAGFYSNPYLSKLFNFGKGFNWYIDYSSRRPPSSGSGKALGVKRLAKSILIEAFKALDRFPWFTSRVKINLRYLFGRGELGYTDASINTMLANSWLERNTRDFFLWIHFMEPHSPYRLFDAYDDGVVNFTEVIRFLELSGKIVSNINLSMDEFLDYISILNKLYDYEVKYVDYNIGLFLKSIEELGVGLEETYLILTSDHGELLGEHGAINHGGILYRELIHVPLIIVGPEIEGGEMVNGVVSHIDLPPTILEFLGIDAPDTFMGRSLGRYIFDGVDDLKRIVISEDYVSGGIRRISCILGRYRYVMELSSSGDLVGDTTYVFRGGSIYDEIKLSGRAGIVDIKKEFREIVLRHIYNENMIRMKYRVRRGVGARHK